ncbi:Lysosomal acid glucosylceramidase [Halotydeus destructor]|nr:Lysosomal acid glucosylceramidase [Halotydeus destructor]
MSALLNTITCIIALATISSSENIPCAPRDYGQGSIVCVCNSTHCDQPGKLEPRNPQLVTVFESNKAGLRFESSTLNVTAIGEENPTGYVEESDSVLVKLEINRSSTFQEILGFGGAFTDSAGININSLTGDLSNKIIENYYSDNGIEYSVGRIPIGGTDFSTRAYSLDDVEDDFELANFSLAEEDYKFKLPLIKLAINMSSYDIKLFATAWSGPAWMKTSKKVKGRGRLIGEPGGKYYKTWAKYYVKFLEAYQSNGVNIWGLTTGNEPTNGFIPFFPFNCMAFKAEWMRDFLKLDLGPTLAESGFGKDKVKIMVMDDQRMLLPKWAEVILRDANASQYVSGTAFHWYLNGVAPASLLDSLHQSYPDKFLLSTEACEGSALFAKKVILGSWERAENYALDIMEDLQHWTTGWVDWNLALDQTGGPNWVNNRVDSPIIVNAKANEFYKQPMFYALGHFSKFVPPGSTRIDSKVSVTCPHGVKSCSDWVTSVAFVTPDKATVVIFFNRSKYSLSLNIVDAENGIQYQKSISPRSFVSFRN